MNDILRPITPIGGTVGWWEPEENRRRREFEYNAKWEGLKHLVGGLTRKQFYDATSYDEHVFAIDGTEQQVEELIGFASSCDVCFVALTPEQLAELQAGKTLLVGSNGGDYTCVLSLKHGDYGYENLR